MREEKSLLEKLRRVLLNVWDPIGVRDAPQAQDEYDDYAGLILGALRDGADLDRLELLLAQSAETKIGLAPDARAGRATAEQLFAAYRREGG